MISREKARLKQILKSKKGQKGYSKRVINYKTTIDGNVYPFPFLCLWLLLSVPHRALSKPTADVLVFLGLWHVPRLDLVFFFFVPGSDVVPDR